MKTKQEQIEEMHKVFCNACKDKFQKGYICPWQDRTKRCYNCENFCKIFYNAGYGDVSEYKAEIEQLNKKLEKQIRIARDANAKFTGVEHYLRPFQYKADRLQTKCNDLKELSDWQRKEIKRLKSEYEQLQTNAEILARGVRDFNHENYELTEKVKQAQTDTINTIVKYCENPNHWRELKDCKLFGGKSNDLRVFLNGIFKENNNEKA